MQNSSLRMGLEVEMHGLWFTFRNTANPDQFWPQAPNGADKEDTMMGRNPILVPQSLANNAAAQYTDQLNWKANWGFLVGGDDFQDRNSNYIVGGGAVSTDFVRCCFELASPAHRIHDARHWAITRKAMQLFYEALIDFKGDEPNPPTGNGVELFNNPTTNPGHANPTPDLWYPIDDLINHYNGKIDQYLTHIGVPATSAERKRWRLKKSYDVRRFENHVGGGHLGVAGNWQGYFTVAYEYNIPRGANFYEIWCDAQVNYEVDLEYMHENLDGWLAVWEHMWLYNMKQNTIRVSTDPNLGHKRNPSSTIVLRNHFHAALWRSAKDKADEFVDTLLGIPPLDALPAQPQLITQVKALVMMLLAVGSIKQDDGGPTNTGPNKNSYSQFPKTSPASIVEKLWGGGARATVRMMRLNHTLPGLGNVSIPTRAEAIVLAMRQVPNLRPYLSGKPHDVKVPGLAANMTKYKHNPDSTIIVAPTFSFANIWRGSFSPAALTAVNHYGYTAAAPFYCYWGLAHTAMPAQRDNATRRIKVLFESRFGHNMLNMGFNPDTTEETFYHAYRSILMLTGPTPGERNARLAIIKTMSTSTSKSRKKFRKKMAAGQRRGKH